MTSILAAIRVAPAPPGPSPAPGAGARIAAAPSPRPRDPARWLFWTFAAALLVGWPINARQFLTNPLLRPGLYSPAWIWTVAFMRTLATTAIILMASETTRRMPLARSMSRRDALAHLLVAVACTGLGTAFDALTASRAPLAPGSAQGAAEWIEALVTYFVIAALFQGVRAMAQAGAEGAREAAERARLARATRRCAQAELRAFRARLSSQTVAATLADVSTLVRRDGAAAHRALAELGAFLRSAALQPAEREVTLREELVAFQPFVELERARLGGRLTIHTHAGGDALDALVPAMLLAPLLESALHTAAPRRDAVDIDISASRDDAGALAVVVRVGGPRAEDACVEQRVCLPFRTEEADADESDSPAATPLALPPHAGLRARAGALARRGARPAGRIAATLAFFAWWMGIVTQANQITSQRLGVTGTLQIDVLDGFFVAAIVTAMMLTAVRLSVTRPWWTSRGGRAARDYRALGVHLLVGAAYGLATSVERICFVVLIGFRTWSALEPAKVAAGVLRLVIGNAILFVVMGAVAYALRAFARSSVVQARRNRSRARAAEAEARQAQLLLGALKAELNPHFLGNALQAAAALMERDAAEAERLLGHIAQLLAAAVAHSHTQEVPLARELEALAPFVAIEQARLGRVIQLQVDVPAALRRAVVPHMILQPLVENAVKHGLAPSEGSAHITIAARSRRGMLELDVVDDGVGPVARAGRRAGQGMRNVRDRLEALYGPRAALDLAAGEGGGAAARVRIPRRGARWGLGDLAPVGARAAAVLP